MKIQAKSLEKLKMIIQQDYGVELSNEELDMLGFSLLKIMRLSMNAFNRSEKKRLTLKNKL